MSATVETASAPSSSAYAECDEFIDYQIQVARTRIKWTDLFTAAMSAGVILIGYVLLFTILDHWVIDGGFSDLVRGTLLAVVICICGGIVYWHVVRPWKRRIHPLYAANMLDKPGSELNGALRSLVDLNHSGASVSETMRRTIEKRAAVRLAEVNVDEAIDRSSLMKLGFSLFALVLLTCLYAVFSPKSISLLRPLTTTETSVATTTRILKVQPGDDSIDAGQQIEILVDLGGTIPDEVTVLYTTEDKTYVNEPLTMQATEDAGRYSVLMVGDSNRGLRQDFSYRVIAGDATSVDYTITVTQPPSADIVQVHYDYPGYMSLPERLSAGGNVDVWEGTVVRFQAESNVPLKTARLQFSDDPSFTTPAEEGYLSINGTQLSGSMTLKLRDDGSSPKYYRVEVRDDFDRIDPSPTVYTVNVRPDLPPKIRILDPIRDLTVPSNAVIPVLISAEDPDFLLRWVRLEFEVNGEPRAAQIPFDATRTGLRKSWTGVSELDLGPLEVKAGDVVRFYAAARDNKPPLGSQNRSGVLQLNVQSAVDPQQVAEKLKQDIERQQQHAANRPSDSSAENTRALDDQKEMTEQNVPVEESNAAEKTGDDDGKQNPGGTQSPTDAKSGENPTASEKANENGSEGSSHSNDANERKNTDNQTSQSDSNSDSDAAGTKRDPAADDEAMQKLLQRYNEVVNKERSSENAGRKDENGSNQKNRNSSQSDGDNRKPGESDATADNPPARQSPDSQSSQNPNDGAAKTDRTDDAGQSADGSGNPSRTLDGEPKENGDPSAAEQMKPEADGSNAEKPETGVGGTPPENQIQKPDPLPGNPEDSNAADSKTGDEPADDKAADRTADTNQNRNPAKGDTGASEQTGKAGNENTAEENATKEMSPPENNAEDAGADKPQQGGQQGQQGGQQGQQGGQQGQQGGQQGQPGGQQGQPGGQQGQPGGQQGQQGGQQGQQGGQQGQQGGQQGQQGGQQGQQGGQQGQQGGQQGQPGGQQGQPGGQQGQPGGQQGQPGGQQGQPGGQQGQPGGQQGQQGGQQGQQGGQQGQQGGQQGQQGGQQGQQGGQQGQQGGQQGQQGGQQGQQGGQQGQQGGQQGQPGGQQGQQGGQQGQQGGQQGQQGGQQGQQGGQQGQPGGQQGQQGGQQGQQGGQQGQQGGQQGQQGGQHGQQGGAGGNAADGGMKNAAGQMGPGGGDDGQSDQRGSGGAGGNGAGAFSADDPDVNDAAQAADLVLKRLQKDLDRGKVDSALLQELGWTEDELKNFSHRMQSQLNSLRDDSEDNSTQQELQRRRVEEMLRSLDLKSTSQGEVGQTTRDREQQDTTLRKNRVPAHMRDLLEMYQKSLSEGQRK